MNRKKRTPSEIVIFIMIILIFCGIWFFISLYLLSDKETFGNMGDKFEIISTLFAGLAFAGLIYTIILQQKELSLQRNQLEINRQEVIKQNEVLQQQAESLEKQAESLHLSKIVAFSSSLPYLIVGLDIDNNQNAIQPAEVEYRKINVPGVGYKFKERKTSSHYFKIINATSQIASHILCILWDDNSNQFRISDPVEIIKPNETLHLNMFSHTFKSNEVSELIDKMYEKRGEYLKEWIEAFELSKQNYILVIFFDISGRLYGIPRAVFFDSLSDTEPISYGKSDLLQPDYQGFAPPFESTTEIMEKLSYRQNMVRKNI